MRAPKKQKNTLPNQPNVKVGKSHCQSKRSWAYINWLQTEKVLIVPKLNIPEDEQAFAQISAAFPAYRGRIEMADATEIVKRGGGFNCCTWIYRK